MSPALGAVKRVVRRLVRGANPDWEALLVDYYSPCARMRETVTASGGVQ